MDTQNVWTRPAEASLECSPRVLDEIEVWLEGGDLEDYFTPCGFTLVVGSATGSSAIGLFRSGIIGLSNFPKS